MKISYSAGSKSTRPTIEQGLKVDYAAAKRGAYKARWYMLLAVIILPMLLILWLLLRPKLLVLAPGIVTTDPVELRAPVAARLLSIDVTEGQQLQAGSVLLQLHNPQLDAQITELQSQLAQLALPVNTSDLAVLQQREAAIAIAADAVTQQAAYLQSYQDFKRSGLVSTHEMAVVQQTLTNAKLALEQAKTEVIQLRQQQEIQALAGTVAQAQRQLQLSLAQLQAQRDQLQLRATRPGKVIVIQVKPGEYLHQDQPLLILSNRPQPVIFAYLPPKYMNYAKPGQQASVKLPNGDKVRATITEPAELLQRLPANLAGPFDGEQAVLRLTLTPQQPLPDIEGLPLEISFDYLW